MLSSRRRRRLGAREAEDVRGGRCAGNRGVLGAEGNTVAKYAMRRLILALPTLALVVTIIFTIIRVVPKTDIADLIVDNGGTGGSAVTKDAIRKQLNLDKPLPVQLGLYFADLVTGDMGSSAYDRKPVASKIWAALPITIEVTLLSVVMSTLLAIVIGVVSAIKQDTIVDYVVRVLTILAFAAPVFWIGTLAIIMPAKWWNYFPPLFFVPFTEDPLSNLQQFMIPSIVLALGLMGSVARMVRSSMLEVMRQDYIRTAYAKGLKQTTVIQRHALKNGFIPVLTFIGLQVSNLLGGTVIVESIFALPGLGTLTISSVTTKDYPVIQGAVLVFGISVVLVNLLVDLSYGLVDPRLRRS